MIMGDPPASRRLVLGSGRSGTTWVLDCVADANELRPLFEPLHPAQSAVGLRYAYQLMVPGDEDDTLEGYFRDLAEGHIRSLWIDYRSRRHRLFQNPMQLTSVNAFKRWLNRWQKHLKVRKSLRVASQRDKVLIKCIRANLMAGWLTRTVGFRTVLIVRHPGAVVESQYRLGSVWDPTPVLDRYRANRKLHDLTGGRYLRLVNSKLSPLQALTLNWIIENQWPVEGSQDGGYEVIYYEDLMSQPSRAWRRLCDALEVARLPNESVLHKPSQQASRAILTTGGPEQRKPSWRSRLTSEQLCSIQAMLDATECDLYRIDDNAPMRSRPEKADLVTSR